MIKALEIAKSVKGRQVVYTCINTGETATLNEWAKGLASKMGLKVETCANAVAYSAKVKTAVFGGLTFKKEAA